ncbi:hypothetical protein RZE82_07890 [Mollicutes bacterium LVI A0039]|nr:hypothetical protein RZE82_07890 [Mollicutes bacterium LVI A0039]
MSRSSVQLIAKSSYASKSSKTRFSNKVAYNNRIANEPIKFTKDRMSFESFKNKVDYNNSTRLQGKKATHDRYFRSHNYNDEVITDEGVLKFKTRELHDFLNKFDDAKVMGMTIVSFSEDVSEIISKREQTEMELYETIKPYFIDFFKENNLNPDNMKWNFAFHSDKKHFHFHLDYVESVPTREKLVMTQQSLLHFKKAILGEIRPELVSKLVSFEKSLNHAKEQARNRTSEIKLDSIPETQLRYMFVLINKEKISNQNKVPAYYKSINDPELKELVMRFAKKELALDDKYLSLIKEYENFASRVYGERIRNGYRDDIKQLELRAANSVWRQLKQSYFTDKTEIKPEAVKVNEELIQNQKKLDYSKFIESSDNNEKQPNLENITLNYDQTNPTEKTGKPSGKFFNSSKESNIFYRPSNKKNFKKHSPMMYMPKRGKTKQQYEFEAIQNEMYGFERV